MDWCQSVSNQENKNLYSRSKLREINRYQKCVILMMGRMGNAEEFEMMMQPRDWQQQ